MCCGTGDGMCGSTGDAAVVAGCGGENMGLNGGKAGWCGCCDVTGVVTGADDGAVVGGPAVRGSCGGGGGDGGGFGHQRVTGTPCQRIGST